MSVSIYERRKQSTMNTMHRNRLFVVTAFVAIIATGSPAFADSKRGSDNGLHLGHYPRVEREDRREARKDARKHDRVHATSSNATSSHSSIEGVITSVSGTILIVKKNDVFYSVQAAQAKVVGHNEIPLSLSALIVGDRIQVHGTLSGSTFIASKIKDKSDETGEQMRVVSAGTITALNGNTVTFTRFGPATTASVAISSSTRYTVNGSSASSSALTVGSRVLIVGKAQSATSSSIFAKSIHIVTEGYNWLPRIWR
jgi:hypothetical protein